MSPVRAAVDAPAPRRGAGSFRLDILLALGLGATAAAAAWWGAKQMPTPMIQDLRCTDVWFDGDLFRMFHNMSSRWSARTYIADRHPLFWLLTFPVVKALEWTLGLGSFQAVRLVLSTVAALWLVGFYTLCRLTGCRRPDAALFSVVAAVSAGAIFWFSVPETWGLGSLTMLLALLAVAAARHARVAAGWLLPVNVLALGVTVTNWMAGLLAAFALLPWRRALAVAAAALLTVVVLSGIQRIFLPYERTMFQQRAAMGFVLRPEAGGPLAISRGLFLHSMVMPHIGRMPQRLGPGWSLSVQHSPAGSSGLWGAAATVCWMALLGAGVWGALRDRTNRNLTRVLGALLAAQWMLHLVFGKETFLYALHVIPLLALLVAFGTFTPARRLVLGLAAVFVVTASVNNAARFQEALQTARAYVATFDEPGAPAP